MSPMKNYHLEDTVDTNTTRVAEVKYSKKPHFSATDFNLIQDILTCQNKAQLLVSTIVYRNTLLAKEKALHFLGFQIPKDNGAAHPFHSPRK